MNSSCEKDVSTSLSTCYWIEKLARSVRLFTFCPARSAEYGNLVLPQNVIQRVQMIEVSLYITPVKVDVSPRHIHCGVAED